MLCPRGNAIGAESCKQNEADEECEACCDDNEGSLLLDLIEVELSVNVQVGIHIVVSPITSKSIAHRSHCV